MPRLVAELFTICGGLVRAIAMGPVTAFGNLQATLSASGPGITKRPAMPVGMEPRSFMTLIANCYAEPQTLNLALGCMPPNEA